MNGREVHRFVKTVTSDLVRELFDRADIPIAELTRAKVASHQVNANSLCRVPEWLQKSFGYAPTADNFYTRGSIEHGNTSGASPLIALDDMNRSGRLNFNDLVMLLAWGAGMNYAGALVMWSKQTPPKRRFEDREEQERLLALFNEKYRKFESDAVNLRARVFGGD